MPDQLIFYQAYAPRCCNKQMLLYSTYNKFECAKDGQSMTKKIYSDAECLNEVDDAPQIYSSRDGLKNGDLHDFNCVSKENVVVYDAYFLLCEDKFLIGTASLATDICYEHLNLSNVTNEAYPDVPRVSWYQLNQINFCERKVVTANAYIDEGCRISADFKTPLSSFTANGECRHFFKADLEGYDVNAQVLACIEECVDT